MGAGGAVALNALAVDKFMDYYDIDFDERLEFQEKVKQIAQRVLTLQHKDQEAKRKAAAKQ